MPETGYRITTNGQIEDGFAPEAVKSRVTALFKAPPDKITRLFSGRRVVIKENLDRETAIKYKRTLQKAGLVCRVVKLDGAPKPKTQPASQHGESAPTTEATTEDQPTEAAPPEEIYLTTKESAGLKPRLLAGFYTFFFVFCLYIVLQLPIIACLHFKYTDLFNGSAQLAGTTGSLITLMRQTNAMASEFNTYKAISFVLAVLVFMVFAPMKSGKTRGQKKMGLVVVNRDNRIARGFIPAIVRLIGAGITIITLGAAYLIPFFHPEKKSLADLISGTRQVQAGPVPRRPILTALTPFTLAIILSLAVAYPKSILLTPHVPTVRKTTAQTTKRSGKSENVAPDFRIELQALKPIRDCGPIVILRWQDKPSRIAVNASYFKGLGGYINRGMNRSMVLELYEKEKLGVVFADHGVDVCLLEPGKQMLPEIFMAKGHKQDTDEIPRLW